MENERSAIFGSGQKLISGGSNFNLLKILETKQHLRCSIFTTFQCLLKKISAKLKFQVCHQIGNSLQSFPTPCKSSKLRHNLAKQRSADLRNSHNTISLLGELQKTTLKPCDSINSDRPKHFLFH